MTRGGFALVTVGWAALAAASALAACSVVNAPEDPIEADGGSGSGASSSVSTGTAGSGGGPNCMSPEVACGDECANTMNDPNHCGSCGNACPMGGFCVQAQCRADCGMLLECGNMCADILTDPLHCGMCNNACGTMAVCSAGSCTACGPGELVCNNVCADVTSDKNNCGSCGNQCMGTEACIGGMCGPPAYQDCKALKAASPNLPDGMYPIDPDGPGGNMPFDAYCDMTTDGGGWTLVYYVDAAHFDGVYGNDFTASGMAPDALNAQRDIWNAELVLTITETLLACTTQNDQNTYFWRYANTDPHRYFSDPNMDYSYQQNTPSAASNAGPAGCIASHKAVNTYGFMVAAPGSTCGNCTQTLWGMYHYPTSPGCNSTDQTYGQHASPYDNRQIEYPICNSTQTSNGKFWIGVR